MEIKQLGRAPQAEFMTDISLPLPLPMPGFLTRNMWLISKNIHVFFGSTVFVNILNLLSLLLNFMCKHTQNCAINDGGGWIFGWIVLLA